MPTSTTDLVNAALLQIGGKRITDMDDGSKEANTARDLFPLVRDALMRASNWNFGIRRVKLARLSTPPAFGFDYAYGLPPDWVRTTSVHDNDGGFGTVAYAEEIQDSQNVILASAENVYLRYVSIVDDPNRWAADFRMAFVDALSRIMAIPVSDSNTLRQVIDDAVKSAVRGAKSTDAMNSTPQRRPRGTWADSRGGWK